MRARSATRAQLKGRGARRPQAGDAAAITRGLKAGDLPFPGSPFSLGTHSLPSRVRWASGPTRGTFWDPWLGVGTRRGKTRPFSSQYTWDPVPIISRPAAFAGSRFLLHLKADLIPAQVFVILGKSLVLSGRPTPSVQSGCWSLH